MEKQDQSNSNGSHRGSNGNYENRPDFQIHTFVSKDGKWWVQQVIQTTFHAVSYVDALLERSKKSNGLSKEPFSPALSAV